MKRKFILSIVLGALVVGGLGAAPALGVTGACCDTNGPDQGCLNNVLDTTCVGPDKVFTPNTPCANVVCVCIPACAGRVCGDDGCGGSCGVCPSDLNVCTVDTCDANGQCQYTPSNAACSDGNICNGSETCNLGSGCAPGTPLACDDGLFCNGTETCDPTLGCQIGTPPNCNDGDTCTVDACDEANDTCTNTPNSTCSEPFATAFTYQAQLDQAGSPLNGTADFQFDLFAVEADGSPVGTTVAITNLAVADGLVAVGLDFGVDVFDGGARWLEVAIRSPHDPTDAAPFTTLSPRQSISPIPYALQTRGIFVDEAGQVSIGVPPNPARALAQPPANNGQFHAAAAPGQLLAILGSNASTSGDAVGIEGTTDSPGGRGMHGSGPREGVRGEATETTGDAVGMKGTTASPGGRGMHGSGPSEGVLGHASGPSGVTNGVRGMADSPGGIGVKGEGGANGVHGAATAAGGTGVEGTTASEQGRGMKGSGPREGILGHATETTGAADGVHGLTDSIAGNGVFGEATSNGTGVNGKAGGSGTGVRGETTGTTGVGVHGLASAPTGNTSGVLGISNSTAGRGVFGQAPNEGVRGEATGPIGPAIGVRGISLSSQGLGVYGIGGQIGVIGEVLSGALVTHGILG